MACVVCGHAEIPERIPYAREPRKLPVVLSADEVVRFLEAVPSLKTLTALTTAYAAGLRASETVGLRIDDVDSGRMVIRVRHGKGGKDRYVMLSAQLLGIVRTYWRLARPAEWLFPGRDASGPIDVQVLYSACRSACTAAGLGKRVTVLCKRAVLLEPEEPPGKLDQTTAHSGIARLGQSLLPSPLAALVRRAREADIPGHGAHDH